jgi:hypothetical protein
MMRYSGIQDDNDHVYHTSQQSSHNTAQRPPPNLRDISDRNFRELSEWGASPDHSSGGRGARLAARKVPPRDTAGAAGASKSGKQRSSDRGAASVTVPDLPVRLGFGVEGGKIGMAGAAPPPPGAGRMDGGAGVTKLLVSNIQFNGEEGGRSSFALHAGARGKAWPSMLQV